MSPEDVELLQLLGRRLLVSLAPSFTHMLFYGTSLNDNNIQHYPDYFPIRLFYLAFFDLLVYIHVREPDTIIVSRLIQIYSHRGLSSSAAWVMLVATCLSFAFATLNISAQIAGFIVFIRVPLISHVDGLPEDRRAITNAALFVPNVIIEWANIFLVRYKSTIQHRPCPYAYFPHLQPLLSDAVVIWRAWVLFPERKRIMIAPLILLLASIGALNS